MKRLKLIWCALALGLAVSGLAGCTSTPATSESSDRMWSYYQSPQYKQQRMVEAQSAMMRSMIPF